MSCIPASSFFQYHVRFPPRLWGCKHYTAACGREAEEKIRRLRNFQMTSPTAALVVVDLTAHVLWSVPAGAALCAFCAWRQSWCLSSLKGGMGRVDAWPAGEQSRHLYDDFPPSHSPSGVSILETLIWPVYPLSIFLLLCSLNQVAPVPLHWKAEHKACEMGRGGMERRPWEEPAE